MPQDAASITREGIVRAWIYQENGGDHWGARSFPNDAASRDFRIAEGGADEEGSMGFNHIVWKRMYGDENDCASIRGYLLNNGHPDGAENINMYHPKNSLLGFAMAASDEDCGASNGLYRAFSDMPSYTTAIPVNQRPEAYCYEPVPRGDESCANGDADNIHEFNAVEDHALNLLVKAMVAYNRGTGSLNTHHYFSDLLLSSEASISDGEYRSTAFGYAMRIKEHTQTLDTVDGYLPYVTYIWQGSEAVEDDPDTDADEAQAAWCYVYGEVEWMEGEDFSEVRAAASPFDLTGRPQVPEGQVLCQ
ncbi:hypothetical protein [Saccharospirillum impatiens]|uniref:hypothetical protein n=1 Tax=Saccharospirillum impatiens TaxID=169438 RepID=UPI00041616A8|nr:hypothetical protein [Saccharospirillum impatiens]